MIQQTMDADYTHDNEGRRTQMVYPPSVSGGGSPRTLDYTFDNMGRPAGMTENSGATTWVSGLTFNVAGQVLTGPHGTYQYNILGQVTRQTYTYGSAVFDEQYTYSATQDNGKMQSKVGGDPVNYGAY